MWKKQIHIVLNQYDLSGVGKITLLSIGKLIAKRFPFSQLRILWHDEDNFVSMPQRTFWVQQIRNITNTGG
jgi:hypothetical protein